jgi:hypothetical protein
LQIARFYPTTLSHSDISRPHSRLSLVYFFYFSFTFTFTSNASLVAYQSEMKLTNYALFAARNASALFSTNELLPYI